MAVITAAALKHSEDITRKKIDTRVRDQTIYETMDRNTFNPDNDAVISTNYYSEAITQAIDTLVNEKEARKPNKTHAIKCITLQGMEIFRGSPRVLKLSDIWEKKNLNKNASREEQKLYKDSTNPSYPIKAIVKTYRSARQIHVDKVVKDYIGEYNGFFKLTQGDMCLYFMALGLMAVPNPHVVYNEWIIDELVEIKRAVNERIFEREEEIKRFYRHLDRSIFDDYLENTEGIE